jgi:hypothetical protein
MKHRQDQARKLAWLLSSPEEAICFSEEYDQYFQDKIRCHGSMFDGKDYRFCTCVCDEFNRMRRPLDVEVIDVPTTSIVSIGMADARALRIDLFKVLKPHLKHAITGSVWHIDGAGKRSKLPYVTIWTPPRYRIDINRGEWSRHNVCPLCGVISPLNFNDKQAVAAWALDERMVYLSTREYLIIDLRLMEKLDLKARFPDLRTIRVRVIEKPLDGDILPGDPGWTGKFEPQDLKAKHEALVRKHAAESALLLSPKSGRRTKQKRKTKAVKKTRKK